jgi:hypothetical protein
VTARSDEADVAAIDLADPRWYPADLDVHGGVYGMLRIERGVIERSTFMDSRLEADFAAARPLPLAAAANLPAAAPAWLLHTSFCCSTLLARALQASADVTVLREPLALRRLADARQRQLPIDAWLAPTVRLLARPWSPHGTVVLKPTHAALNIAGELLDAAPEARAVVLTSSLEDFLVSNLKKTPETQARIPELVERALQACSLRHRLPPAAFNPPTLIAAAGLQWAAQRELLLDIADADRHDRMRVLDAGIVLADLPEAVRLCFAWWRIAVDPDAMRTRAAAVAGQHAKAETHSYDAARRGQEAAGLARRFAAELHQARAWLDAVVLPAVRAEALTLERGALALHR